MNLPNTTHQHGGSRAHPAWWAFVLHRLSGLALAVFLPLHFLALGQAMGGEAGLDGFLHWTANPLVKFAEWGLVLLLALHATGGVRLLLIEFGPWKGLRLDAFAVALGLTLTTGLAFALVLVG